MRSTGSNDQALDYFRNSLAIRERLAAGNAANTTWQHDIGISHNKIADVLVATGKPDDAVAHYQQALTIAQRLVAAEPDDDEWQRDLSSCYIRLGDAVAPADRPRAQDAYRKALAIRDKLAAADTANIYRAATSR